MLARIADVSLGTLRTVFIVHGRKGIAFFVGFAEILIWIVVVAGVIQNVQQPAYALSYALGFGLGTYLGIVLEGWFGLGEQVLRIFTRQGPELAAELRERGHVVTVFEGSGREGPISMLFLKTPRRQVGEVVDLALARDPGCFYIVDDIRLSSGQKVRFQRPTGWRNIAKKK